MPFHPLSSCFSKGSFFFSSCTFRHGGLDLSLLHTDSDAWRRPRWENKETAFSAEGSVCVPARGSELRNRKTERNKSRKNTSLFSCSASVLFAFKSLMSVYLSPPPTVFPSARSVGPVQRPNLQTGAIVQSGLVKRWLRTKERKKKKCWKPQKTIKTTCEPSDL